MGENGEYFSVLSGGVPNKQSELPEAAERGLGYPKGYPNPLLAKTPVLY